MDKKKQKKSRDGPISLYGLSFEEAVSGLLKKKPTKKKQETVKGKRKKGDG